MADCEVTRTEAQRDERWLLTSPGLRLANTNYSLGERQVTAELATVALIKLLPEEKRPSHVVALVTEAAQKETLPYLQKEAGCDVIPVRVPDGKSPDEIWNLLSCTLENVPSGVHLTIDVTHGFRSLPFVYLTASLFLTALRNVIIEGVYYGMLEAKDNPKPLVDLSMVLELAEWFYATRIFRETGLAKPLVRLLEIETSKYQAKDVVQNCARTEMEKLVKSLGLFSQYYAAGLPLEAGFEAKNICKSQQCSNIPILRIPAGVELLQTVIEAVEPLRLADESKKDWKKSVHLSQHELNRQASLVDLYLQREQYGTAVQLIREWIVNRVLLSEHHKPDERIDWWLGTNSWRAKAESRLNALRSLSPDLLTPNHKKIRDWWRTFSDFRNKVAHCGFRPEVVDVTKNIAKIQSIWSDIMLMRDDDSFWRLDLPVPVSEGILLVSPLGMTRGALFTALKKIQPQLLLPIVSKESWEAVGDVVRAAGFIGEVLPPLMMEDPFQGFSEIKDFVGETCISAELAKMLLRGSKVVVNLTGGTTVMQQLAQRVAEVSQRDLGLETSIVAMIDRRTRREQEENPYVEGEMVDLTL